MKKTIIALSLATVFAAPAFAATVTPEYATVDDAKASLEAAAQQGNIKISHNRGYTKITGNNGVSHVIKQDRDGGYTVMRNGENVKVEVNEKGEITSVGGEDAAINWKVDDTGSDQFNNEVRLDDLERAAKDGNKVIDDATSEYNRDVKSANNWAAQAEQQFKQEIGRLDNKIDTVEGRVSNGAAMTGAMSQMQFGHSGLGVGAGVSNFNGSNAIAVGVGYAFGNEKQWMAKGSLGYAKSNKGSGSEDTMAAAGLTYSFN